MGSTCQFSISSIRPELLVKRSFLKRTINGRLNSAVAISSVLRQKYTLTSKFGQSLKSSCSRTLKSSITCKKSSSANDTTSGTVERVTVLVIGGSGREHALCYALQRSPSCDAVFCAPGNAGIEESGTATCIPELSVSDSSAVIAFCREWDVGLVVIGPDALLVAGLADDLLSAGLLTFGPSAEAAALKGSKGFLKKLSDKYSIPTTKYEESPEGEEVSFFALVDGETALPLESAQDHRIIGDGETGQETIGMGAYSPAPIMSKELQSAVMESIILPTVKGMAAEGCPYVGVLYARLMIEKKSGLPKLIEYNVRFGDPECQVLMARLKSDLAQVFLASCQGRLNSISLEWHPESAMVVVMASRGHTENHEKTSIIRNLEEAELMAPTVKVFHAGTSIDANGNFVATGGRSLGVTAKGKDIEEAHDRAYDAIEEIDWPEGFYRHDIGWNALHGRQLV